MAGGGVVVPPPPPGSCRRRRSASAGEPAARPAVRARIVSRPRRPCGARRSPSRRLTTRAAARSSVSAAPRSRALRMPASSLQALRAPAQHHDPPPADARGERRARAEPRLPAAQRHAALAALQRQPLAHVERRGAGSRCRPSPAARPSPGTFTPWARRLSAAGPVVVSVALPWEAARAASITAVVIGPPAGSSSASRRAARCGRPAVSSAASTCQTLGEALAVEHVGGRAGRRPCARATCTTTRSATAAASARSWTTSSDARGRRRRSPRSSRATAAVAPRSRCDGRLVGDQHRRLLRERDRDLHALQLAAGERRQLAVGELGHAGARHRAVDRVAVVRASARCSGPMCGERPIVDRLADA